MSYDRASRGNVAGRLAGKIVLITGAGGGMGRTTAILFAEAGATVIACGRTPSSILETTELAEQQGLRIDGSPVDAADRDAVKAWVDAAAARYGGIDVLYNNAGALRMAMIPDMSQEDWQYTVRNELDIAFFPTQAVWPHLIARGGGSIVNISSTSGLVGLEGMGAVAHCAAKGGVDAMTRQMALEGAPHWIRCNSISPGPIYSPGLDEHGGDPVTRKLIAGWPLLPRIGYAEDIAYTGLFLASDESTFITGSLITVDGGMVAKSGYTAH